MNQRIWSPDDETLNVEVTERMRRARAIVAKNGTLTGYLGDLRLLQSAVDEPALPLSDVAGWQALGIAFGWILANELSLHWVMVEDEYGRDPALQFGDTSTLLFPLTMISKRIERGERPILRELLDLIRRDLATRHHAKPPLQ